MLFNSYIFLFVFLPIVLGIYFPLRLTNRERAAKLFLIAASLFFYGWWEWKYVPLVLISIGVNYGMSVWLDRKPAIAKPILIATLIFNLGLLGYFKYANFFVETFDALTGMELTFRKVLLPLAISFFTFQQVAYIVEVYKDRKAAQSLTDYGLFVLFFPHLIAGPITHHKEMLPQFAVAGRGPLPWFYLTTGLTILILGLGKKVIFADTLAKIADPVFAAARLGDPLTAVTAWTGALAYTFQLYFDFSGYSDMAIGLALMFGIRMPVNFASPYKATSIIDFWRRWHISLSRFLRNYLYIPLGGNRQGPVRRHLNLMITMALGGLWHGAGWTFLAWGVLHGSYLVINHLFRQVAGKRGSPARDLFGWALTFLGVVVAWVLFRAETFDSAALVLKGMVGVFPADGLYVRDVLPIEFVSIAIAAMVAFFLPSSLELARYPHAIPGGEYEAAEAPLKPRRWPLSPPVTALLLGVVFAIVIAKLPDPGVFLYFNF